jgi:hypothetical protein
MFGQLCVALCVADADGEGVAAVLAGPASTAVVAVFDEFDVAEDVCAVAALATAMLAPNPTPNAPAPIAVPMMILPSLVFNVSASSRSGGPALRTPARAADTLQRRSVNRMKPSDYRMKWRPGRGRTGPESGEIAVTISYRRLNRLALRTSCRHHVPLGPVALLVAMSYLSLYVTLPPVILLFPDGVLPSTRWRWVLGAYLAVVGCLVVGQYAAVVSVMLAHQVRFDASGGLAAIDNPSGRTAWLSPVLAVGFPVLIGFWLVFVGRLVLSWRRTGGEQRQQLKCLLSGSAVALTCGITAVLTGVFFPHPPVHPPPGRAGRPWPAP